MTINNDRNKGFNVLYKQCISEREKRLGNLTSIYNVPKYANVFFEYFRNETNLEILELGAGTGQITEAILNKNSEIIKNYIATEITEAGVAELKKLDIRVEKMDAEQILFDDNSFDLVCCFDVLHHVIDCRKMAYEMSRVARKYVFLIESNGLCIFRKLMELTPSYRSLNESSYTPWRYKSFFPQEKFEEFRIRPFLFTPPHVPRSLYKFVIGFNEVLERVPMLRFQCSSVAIFGRKRLK